MTDTPLLGLPQIEAAQAQKHVTHNEALRILDTLVQLSVADRDLNAPPGSPGEGDRYIVAATPAPTGAWAGHSHAVAAWRDGAWQFSTPQVGWIAYVADEGTLVVFDGSAWGAALQNLSLLGVGTTADSTNPFSAKLNNTLWAAKTVAEGGDGNLRYKLSKESAAKTLSFLFQDNFSGRAEIGLTGDDDFHFKVSPDGSSWVEALKIDRATGKVTFPVSGGPREVLSADRTYYVATTGSDSNSGLSAGTPFQTVQKALDTIATAIDFNGKTVTIQIADGTYAPASGVRVADIKPWVGGGALNITGNPTTPGNVVFSGTNITPNQGAGAIDVRSGALPGPVTLNGVKITTTTAGMGINIGSPCSFSFLNVEFGACASFHFACGNGAFMQATGGYTISGGGLSHIVANPFGQINVRLQTITLTGTPAFSAAFAQATFGYMNVSGNTWSGSATGPRYSASLNGVINTGGSGANYLPGNAAGSTATGGQYL